MDHAGYIDGAFVAGTGEHLRVENPSDESTVDELTGLAPTQVDEAIAAARRAFDRGGWADLAATARADTLRRFVAAMASRADRLRELAVAEAGCPVASSVMAAQVSAPLYWCRTWRLARRHAWGSRTTC